MQRSHLSATWVVALLVVASLTATGCAVAGTGSGTNSSVVNVQGSFATANLSAAIVARSSARSILPGYNIRIYTMSGASFSANDYETVSIQSDGAFSFEVPRGDTFVAILVDTQAPFRKAVGVIGIGTAVGQYWEQIATSELDGDIVMGNVATTPTDDGVLPSQVGLTDMLDKVKDSSAIDRLSRLDNAVRLLMNAINGEPGISTTLNYIFGQTDTEFETILGQFPTDIAYGFAGYQVLLFPSTGADGATLSAPAEGTLIT